MSKKDKRKQDVWQFKKSAIS